MIGKNEYAEVMFCFVKSGRVCPYCVPSLKNYYLENYVIVEERGRVRRFSYVMLASEGFAAR